MTTIISGTSGEQVGTTTFTPANPVGVVAQTSVNSYAQAVIQNSNSGSAASTDFIVNNDLGTDSTNYGDFGMNSSTFSGSGAFSDAGGVYLYSQSSTLALGTYNASALKLATNNTVGLTMDSSQNVGIGTSSPQNQLHIAGTATGYARFQSTNRTFTLGSLSSAYGFVINDVDAASERMRIDSSGNLLVGTATATGLVTSSQSATSAPSVAARASSSSFANDVVQIYCARDTNNSSYNYILAQRPAGVSFVVRDSGNVQNANNSYGAISDVKLKENIVDATSKLEGLMQVKIRNYNLKSDPEHKQLGVIAQELESIFPSLVEETQDRDEEGNLLETTTKSVKYSVFVPMLIKAIQEQQALIQAKDERIQILENYVSRHEDSIETLKQAVEALQGVK